jgi:hypothetical protein
MSIEVISGIGIILIVAIWAAFYIHKRNRENNNEHLFDFIPHLFPTLGILFTFLGIAIGLWNFDSNDIERSIPELMNGLKTAFLVSIFGVALLVLFSFWTNIKRKRLEEGVLSEETIAIQKLTEVLIELKNDYYSTDENGHKIKPGNILRDIYEESTKQSKALQSFSTDLANKVEAGFEKIISTPDQGVILELQSVKSSIENLGSKLQDPTTEMTQNVVKALQDSLGSMIDEFKASMSGSTKTELEHLISLLSQAGGSLTDFPAKLQGMTNNLNENFRELQAVIQQISKQTLSQSEQSTEQMRKQVEEMSEILKSKVGDLQIGQEVLMTKQSENLQVSDKLLTSFNSSIQKMNELSIDVTSTISQFKNVQLEFNKTSEQLKAIATNVNASSNYFKDAQVKFSQHSNQFLENNAIIIDEIQKALLTAKDVSTDYSQKFAVIEKGLQGIFIQIQTGLDEYRNSVRTSLNSYLKEYTDAHTNSVEKLASAISKQEDILQYLDEHFAKFNAKK